MTMMRPPTPVEVTLKIMGKKIMNESEIVAPGPGLQLLHRLAATYGTTTMDVQTPFPSHLFEVHVELSISNTGSERANQQSISSVSLYDPPPVRRGRSAMTSPRL